ncbi:RICIN domain-containing protein [Aquimarina sp. RZ0]|uniref:RICIN domain-containing protein n=1 Tax=Aquimarina sp. RZ0 TaxID=2607730 RepID=UPI0011F276B5|nr:RICIN domain-containing protein [Aquimarina sp. RZ0]KAA1244053.1 T9SS type A sorting domain-containing protein [Aquimarina sp. RZ0]
MKKKQLYVIVFTILCAGFLKIQAQTPVPPNGKKWEKVQVLSDEFNGNSLDASKWDDYHPHWSGRPPSRFKRGNAFVEGGYLKLRSTLLKNPSRVDNPLKDIWVNSAACVSKGKTAKPGYYYEARFKASSLSMTSSFWFRVGQFSEIDVIEHIGNPSRANRQDDLPFQYHANTHYYGPHAGKRNLAAEWKMPTRGRDGFHTYGFWWKSPTELLFYYDGQQVMKIVPRVPLTENLKMIFDTEVFPFAQAGVPNIGLPKVANLNDNSKNTMQVDWVRTYKLVEGTSGPSLDDTVSFNNPKITITPKKSYTFNMKYTASVNRDIVVSFWKNNEWVASNKVTVPRGSGTKEITVSLPSAPAVGNGYGYKAHIRPVRTTWQQALDDDEVNNVHVKLSVPDDQLIANGTFFIISSESNQRILSRSIERHSAVMHDPLSFNDQRWSFSHLEDNVYTIKNVGTNRYLQVPNAKCANGENVTTWTAASKMHQKWKIARNGSGVYSLKPMHCTELALDRAGGAIDANIQVWEFKAGNKNQKWKIEPINNRSFDDELIKGNTVQVYPNPVQDMMEVTGVAKGDIVNVYDVLGNVVFHIKATADKEVISTDLLSPGMYIISVSGKTKIPVIKR